MGSLGSWQGEGVCDVAVGVECILVHLTVLGIPGTSRLSQHVKGRSPDATDVVAKNFNFSKDCGADNKEWQGKVGMQLRHQTILPPDVVLVHINLEGNLQYWIKRCKRPVLWRVLPIECQGSPPLTRAGSNSITISLFFFLCSVLVPPVDLGTNNTHILAPYPLTARQLQSEEGQSLYRIVNSVVCWKKTWFGFPKRKRINQSQGVQLYFYADQAHGECTEHSVRKWSICGLVIEVPHQPHHFWRQQRDKDGFTRNKIVVSHFWGLV